MYDLFSKRDEILPDVFQYDYVPDKLRQQIIWVWRYTFHTWRNHGMDGAYSTMRNAICMEHGLPHLYFDSEQAYEAVPKFFVECKAPLIVLDLVELSCGLITKFHDRSLRGTDRIFDTGNTAINEINSRFRENGIGYEYSVDAEKLIRVDNQFLHADAVRPTLSVLTDPKFKTANTELIEAFDHHKQGEYGDCLTKCFTAFESVLKIICKEKKWSFKPTDTAAPLIKTVIQNSPLPSFLTDPISLIATLRNRLSSSHGAGPTPKNPPDFLARYALHATCVRRSLCEVFSNVFRHAKSPIGGIALGQLYPNMRNFQICICDLGVGIVRRVQNAGHGLESPLHAIRWALKPGNSTWQGNEPPGLGLHLLREFVKVNGGVFRIYANNGVYSEVAGNPQEHESPIEFPGTLVELRLQSRDDVTLDLRYE